MDGSEKKPDSQDHARRDDRSYATFGCAPGAAVYISLMNLAIGNFKRIKLSNLQTLRLCYILFNC